MIALIQQPRAQLALRVAASVPALLSLGLLAYVIGRDPPTVDLFDLAGLFSALATMSCIVALRLPQFPLAASLAYVGSPLSFFIVFRHTSSSFAYPAARDLSLDAAVTLGLLAGSVVPVAGGVRSWRHPFRDRLLIAMVVISTVWALTALVGAARGNPIRYIVTDLIPVAEIVLGYIAANRLFARPAQLRALALVTTGSLAVTAVIRLGFYPLGTRGFGVTQQGIGSHLIPRLFLVQPFAWLAPLCAIYGLTARTRKRRRAGGGLAVVFGTCVLLSFERGTWVILGCAMLPVLAVVLWTRPRLALGALGAAVLASVALTAVGKGSYNPIVLVVHRLAYTRTQVFDPNEPLQHKRSDEAHAITREIRHHPSYWPAGAGLGATYIGPTGFRDIGYQQSFRRKHYSFNAYLAVALRSGLLGLAALACLIAAMLQVAWRSARLRRAKALRLAGSVVFGGTVALVGISVVDPEILIHPLALYLGATFGILSSALQRTETEATTQA